MKYFFIPVLSAALCVQSYAAEQEDQTQDYVVQSDPTNAELFSVISVNGPDNVGSADGDFTSKPIFSNGAHFELWGIGLGDDTNHYLLDEQITAAHIPSATITVSSQDPYSVVTRTRADKPFMAQYTISDILSDADAPLSSKYLYFERLVGEFPEGEERPAIDDPNGEEALRVVESYFINGNGTSGLTEVETSLDMRVDEDGEALLDTQKGEERIRIYALPNENREDWFVLEEKKVYVWPIAEAQIYVSTTGESTDKRILPEVDEENEPEVLHTAPTIFVDAQNLYPSSSSFLRIYKGEKVDTVAEAEQISSTMHAGEYELAAYDTVTPQEMSSIVDSSVLEDILEYQTTYTIELVTTTPFATNETVAWTTFQTPKEGLKINANNITTAE